MCVCVAIACHSQEKHTALFCFKCGVARANVQLHRHSACFSVALCCCAEHTYLCLRPCTRRTPGDGLGESPTESCRRDPESLREDRRRDVGDAAIAAVAMAAAVSVSTVWRATPSGDDRGALPGANDTAMWAAALCCRNFPPRLRVRIVLELRSAFRQGSETWRGVIIPRGTCCPPPNATCGQPRYPHG